ncbi:MAG: DUF2306 domain-containing protein [Saprospiraceae bacterium]|nr:DUF2306 domain-containing protein [Lewinella sp.]
MVSDIQLEEQAQTIAEKKLHQVTRLLFAIGVIGQLLFVYYIVAFYGGVVVNGTYEKINEQLPHGIIPGDKMGNFALAVHLSLAAVITFGGPIQFITAIRKRLPVFHRWNGRIYYVTAFLVSGAGLYMNATRGAHGGMIMALGNASNALLIMTFSVMAWHMAMQREFRAHKKWALRAFLMVSGVWFFRMGYGLWILLTGFTGVGANATLSGPFDRFLAFGHWLVPLLLLEFYFYARASSNAKVKRRATILFAGLCLLLAVGIGMVTMVFWMPVL